MCSLVSLGSMVSLLLRNKLIVEEEQGFQMGNGETFIMIVVNSKRIPSEDQ